MGEIYVAGLSIKRGSKHNYFGMNLEFFINGAIEVKMFKYLNNMIEEFLKDTGRKIYRTLSAVVFSKLKMVKIESCCLRSRLYSSTI